MTAPNVMEADRLAALPRIPMDEGGPVFSEPWQAQAFALAVKLSEARYFTWKEWAATLADELKAAGDRGEADDGSRYYGHWLAALEHLVTAKGLTSPTALRARKEAWTAAYKRTPHGRPVELFESADKPDARWILLGLGCSLAAYWMIQHAASFGEWGIHNLDMSGRQTVIPQVGFLASGGLGTLLGMRHALEPDHLAAVSTLLTGERSSTKAAWLGACWGVGHTLTLLIAGSLLVVLRGEMPAVASQAFELCVVLMLAGFGVRAIYHSACRRSPAPSHVHARPGARERDHPGQWRLARRPLIVGAVHGLAGSGALTALVVTTLPSIATRLAYLALFGAGSTVGMAVLSGLLGWPIARVGRQHVIARGLSLTVGCTSIALGFFWGHPILSRWL